MSLNPKRVYRGKAKANRNAASREHYRKNAAARRKKQREYRAANRLRTRDQNLRSSYGFGIDEFHRRCLDQDGGCAVCGGGTCETLHVDHDHKTGQVRGLLCPNCNTLLGRLEARPCLMPKFIAYGGLTCP